jgi:hypothetical protein
MPDWLGHNDEDVTIVGQVGVAERCSKYRHPCWLFVDEEDVASAAGVVGGNESSIGVILDYELEYLDNSFVAADEPPNDEEERTTLIRMFESLQVVSLASWWKYFLVEYTHLSSHNLGKDHTNKAVLPMTPAFDLVNDQKLDIVFPVRYQLFHIGK